MDTKRLLSVAAVTCLTLTTVIVGQNERIKEQATEIQNIKAMYEELRSDRLDLALTLVDTASANTNLQLGYIQASQELRLIRGASQYHSATAPMYDIMLSEDLQQYTYDICRFYGMDYPLILAVIWKESNFDITAANAFGCYGLMQINIKNLESLVDNLGSVDLLDARDNIKAGVYLLAGLYNKYGDIDKALMVYNMGSAAAQDQWLHGNYTSAYTTAVHEKEQKLSKIQ